jgi:hypothetical protein
MAEDTKKKPWMKWYWADWKAGADLRSCSLAARGLWAEMLAIMDEANPYGHLLINGKPLNSRQIANQVGGGSGEKQVKDLLAELEDAGVFSKTDQGVIYCRRMVRDHAKSENDRQNGLKGGNPTLKGVVNPNDKPKGSDVGKPPDGTHPLTPPVKAQRPEARGQKPEAARLTIEAVMDILEVDRTRVLHGGPVLKWLESASHDEITTCCRRLKPRMPTNLNNALAWVSKALPDELAKLRQEEGKAELTDERQAAMCRVYYGIGTYDPVSKKAGAPWHPRPIEQRAWPPYFDCAPPFKPGTKIADAVAIAVLGELGLDINEEVERARA